MLVHQLDHFTITCRPDDLATTVDFYTSVLGLIEGARPDFPFPGAWLYANGQPIVHLAGLLDEPVGPGTGPLDHIAFSGRDLDAARAALQAMAVPYDEAPVPGFPLHQIFVRDPNGLKLELTFRTGDPEP